MKDSIFDEKEELMVSPLGGIPQMRKAHFLKPTVSSIEGPSLKLPSLPFSSESESSSGVPPKCNREIDKENLSVEVRQIVACDVVPPGSVDKHVVWEDDRNESDRNTARDLMTKCDDLITVIELQFSEFERQVASHRRC